MQKKDEEQGFEKTIPNSGSNEYGNLLGSFLYPRGPEFVFSNGRSA